MSSSYRFQLWFPLGILLLISIVSCSSESSSSHSASVSSGEQVPRLIPVRLAAGEKLHVVATTSIVADVVAQIAGENIDLVVLMPPGTDPHSFEPTPQDAAAIADAHVVFINGIGLETFIDPLLASAGQGIAVVSVSQGADLLHLEEISALQTDTTDHEEETHEHEGLYDPHVWFDPTQLVVWTHNIEAALSTLDPNHASAYHERAEAYRARLEALHQWIVQQIAQIPEKRRVLVSDHVELGYLARRYELRQVGAVIPGYSTLAEPSAQEMAALEDTIRSLGVRAIFVGRTVNPRLAERIAADTGIQIVFLYTGSLSAPDGPAPTYEALMRYNVTAIVNALR